MRPQGGERFGAKALSASPGSRSRAGQWPRGLALFKNATGAGGVCNPWNAAQVPWKSVFGILAAPFSLSLPLRLSLSLTLSVSPSLFLSPSFTYLFSLLQYLHLPLL